MESINIRFATALDINELVKLGMELHAFALEADLIPFDEASLRTSFIDLLNNPDSYLIVAESNSDGLVGGVLLQSTPCWYNLSVKVLKENAMFVRPSNRTGIGSQLVIAAEEVAKQIGAKIVYMGGHVKNKQERIDKFYNGLGYSRVDSVYIKEV